MTRRARTHAAPHRADEKVCPICYRTTRKRARTWCNEGHEMREMLTDNERRRRWLDRHQRQDPHCTCNDCQQAWIDATTDALIPE